MPALTVLTRLIAAACSREGASWSTSALAHIGICCALAISVAATRPPRPSLSGQRQVASIQAINSIPQPDLQGDDLELGDVQVIVRPELVEIADQHFRPAPPEVQIPAVELVRDDRPEVLASDHPAEESPPDAPPLPARPQQADIPPSEAQLTEANPTERQPADQQPRESEPSDQRPPRLSKPSPASAASRQSVGLDDIISPRAVSNPPPIYPEPARQNGHEGTVVLRLSVSDRGHVTEVSVAVSSGHAILDAAAVRAVRAWRFAPAESNSGAVAWTGRLPIRFTLSPVP